MEKCGDWGGADNTDDKWACLICYEIMSAEANGMSDLHLLPKIVRYRINSKQTAYSSIQTQSNVI